MPPPEALSAAPDSVPEADLRSPHALKANTHPRIRTAVRRTLNIKRFPLYAPCAHASEPNVPFRPDSCPLYIVAARGALYVQQQVLTLPGADDLGKGLVLGFLDCGIGEHEAVAEQVPQRLGLTHQAH